ncbi:MAG: ferrochelatase [Proteobacteria bacterium]|nr:ferrochelatase [Pseudomonadota bacterium]
MAKPNSRKIAVILFNLGGPDKLASVKPFLFNLFNDSAIINLPQPLRFLLAKLISLRRAPVARDIYEHMGGKSPLLENTEKQAEALDKALGKNFKCFVVMRYWHPFSAETAARVKDFGPDRVVLLPLYPQFSTTTSASSLEDWAKAAKKVGIGAVTSGICCFPTEKNFIAAHTEAIKPLLINSIKAGPTRILFTAHGLPEKIIEKGDPYAWQVKKTVAAVMASLWRQKEFGGKPLDYVICYQSRVGPLKWIGPSTEAEIIRAGEDGKNLVVVPISFVSEHSETLVELDIEYARLAKANKIKHYTRVPALGDGQGFILSLQRMVENALSKEAINPAAGNQICPADYVRCPCKESGR